MKRLEVQAWEANHPLNGKACPVTGKLAHIENEWKVSKSDYRLRTGILEPGIVLSFPVGYTALCDTKNFFNILNQIRRNSLLNSEKFVLIEDYTFHTGSDYEGRLSYIKRMIEEIEPAGIVFITRSTSWKLSIKMAQVVSGTPFPIKHVNSYRGALQIASEILGRPIVGLENRVTRDRLVRVHYSVSIDIVSPYVATVIFSGNPKEEDLSAIAEFYLGLSTHPKLAEEFTIIHDLSMVQLHSMVTIWKILHMMFSEQCKNKRLSVFVNGKLFVMRNMLRVMKVMCEAHHGKVIICRNVEEALKEISKINKSHGSDSSLSDTMLLQAMEMLDKIDWTKSGHYELDIINDPQLKPLALMLGALKQDVDYYLKERMGELKQLEEKHKRAQKLSMDIEQALRRSEDDRIKTEELSRKNLLLSEEINQSQKEVFIVLADHIDKRAGIPKGTTKKMARLVQYLAPMLGYSIEDAERLHDATLLYHVGYLGVAENETDSTAHCQVGGEVLGSIFTFLMQFAAQAARSHHEKWNGTGFPDRLIGDQIPREARLIAIAEFLLLEHSQPLEFELTHEVGKAFDPAMVAVISKYLNSIREFIEKL